MTPFEAWALGVAFGMHLDRARTGSRIPTSEAAALTFGREDPDTSRRRDLWAAIVGAYRATAREAEQDLDPTRPPGPPRPDEDA